MVSETVSACDVTAPIKETASLDRSLRESRDAWHATARYGVWLTPPFSSKDPEVRLASWMTHCDAKALDEKWNACYGSLNPMRHFNRPLFLIRLETPAQHLASKGAAAVGDFVVTPCVVETPIASVLLSFWRVGRVIDTANGQITAYENSAGRHERCPKKTVVVPSGQFDLTDAIQRLADYAEHPYALNGEFRSPEHVIAVLRPALRLPSPKKESDQQFKALIRRYSD